MASVPAIPEKSAIAFSRRSSSFVAGMYCRHPPDVRTQGLQERPARTSRTPCEFRRERRHGTPAGDIIDVLEVEVRIDQGLQLAPGRRLLDRLRHAVPDFLEALFEGLGEETLFAVEVSIEATVRQAEVSHQIANGGPFAPATAEPAGRRSDDPLPGLLFVFG